MKPSILVVTLLVVAGCGGGTTSETASTRATSDTTVAAAPTDTSPNANAPAGPGGVAAVQPAAEPRDIWEQLRAQLSELNSAIGAGRLGEVHDRAENLKRLVAALDGKVPASQAGRLQEVATAVAAIADRMHDAADNGDLTGTKQQFTALEAKMKDVEALTHSTP